MSDSVVLYSTFVSSDRKRFPTRCQKRYARCGLPPESREPKTTSARPRSIGSTSAGTSEGSYSMSASWITAMSPSIRAIAVLIAAPLPRCACRITTAPFASAMAAVRSVEPSSTTITWRSSSSRSIASSTAPIVASSLCAGTRNETFTRPSVAGAARVGDDRRDRAEDEADQRPDEDRVAAGARGGRHCDSGPDHLRALDVLRQRELLLRGRLEPEQLPAACLRVVELRRDHEPVERRERLVVERPLEQAHERDERVELVLVALERLLEGRDLRPDVRPRRLADDDPCEVVRGARHRARLRPLDGDGDQRHRRPRGAGSDTDLCRRDLAAQRPDSRVAPRGRVLERRLAADDLVDRARVRSKAVDRCAAAGRERLPQGEERLRLVVRAAAE